LRISSDVNGIRLTKNLMEFFNGIRVTFVDDNDAHTANSSVCEPSNRKCPLKSLYTSQPKLKINKKYIMKIF